MKSFLAACVFAVAVAIAAPYVLMPTVNSASDAFKTSSVRLDDPGHNLIGK